ncbi:MAG: MBL fold metallo-hydrolase [Hydrogenophaga sp.]|nr:MBL fold metallo-hydrolase [Hydrogenophaga sp.]
MWVWAPETPAEVSVANGGHVAPTTLVLGGSKALVIDPGPSHAHAWRVRESVRCRFRARVRWVVNTHAHAENVLGNSAFAEDVAQGAVEILATAATREAMALRCPACLASLRARVGDAAMAGTRIVLPGRTLLAGDELRVGEHRLKVLPVEQGHTEGDLVLWEADRGLLWAGGLVYEGRVPELAQGRLDDWLAALQRLQALRPAVVVSTGVSRAGPSGLPPPALLATLAYLLDLRAAVLQAMDAGRQPQEPGVAALPAYRSWVGYAERHDFNVQRAWRELEPVWMDQGMPPPPADGSAQDVGR